MIWQYIVVGVVLAVVIGVVVARLLSARKSDTPENPFCAGCALAKNCTKRKNEKSDCKSVNQVGQL